MLPGLTNFLDHSSHCQFARCIVGSFRNTTQKVWSLWIRWGWSNHQEQSHWYLIISPKYVKRGNCPTRGNFSDSHDENLIFISCLLPSITQGVFYQWLDFHDFFLLFDPSYSYSPNLARFHCKVILNLSALSCKLKLVVIKFLFQIGLSWSSLRSI